MEGSTISNYQILEQIGSGGMGVVYKAHDTRLDRIVALKFLPDHLSFDEEAKKRFTREAKTASALDHPNICTIFEIGEHEGQTFISMAYYEGETLQDKIERGSLPVEEAIDYISQMTEGLAQSHEKDIVHRDVKPANVLVTTQGRVKLLDFGLAKAIEQTQLTKEGSTPGTIAYMSPEQVRGETIDGRSDLWALGTVFYEMLTGERPFRGVYDQAIIYGILNEDPAPIKRLRSGVSAGIGKIVETLLAKDADKRYQTAEELLTDLVKLREKESPSTTFAESDLQDRTALPTDRTALPTEKSPLAEPGRVKQIIAGAALLAVIAAVWILGPGARQSQEPVGAVSTTTQSIAVLPFETLGQSESTPFTQGVHGDVLTRLSNVSSLRVISRTSVRQYRNTEKTAPEIGRELDVTWLLEGDVQEASGQVRVNVRLIDIQEDRQIWAENYLEALTAENIFLIQGEITRKIVEALELHLTPAENQRIEDIPTENLVAYRFYVQGQTFLNERTEQGMRRAADYFQQAIEADADYALAWVGRADALILLYNYGFEKANDVLSLAEEAIQEASRIDPELPEAYASLGLLYSNRHDGEKATQHLMRAVELRPGYANAHNWLSWGHLVLGHREAALESARRAAELDPLSPEIVLNLTLAYLVNGDAERALVEARRESELQSTWTSGKLGESLALYDLGRYSEAESVLENLVVEWAGSGPRAVLALVHVASGDLDAARILLNEFENDKDYFATGLVFAAMGQKENAFEAFQNTNEWNEWRSLAIRLLFRDVWTPLTGDPRYAELLKEVDRAWQVETR